MSTSQGMRRSRTVLRTNGVFALGLLLMLAGCHTPVAEHAVGIEISHLAGDQALRLGEPLTTAGGDELRVDKLRYYLSNVRLRRGDAQWWTDPQTPQDSHGYFLVDEAVAATKRAALAPVPTGDYDGIEFMVGVDEARNHAGAQSGTLDPARGMFWTWASGYIFIKLEGRSPQSPAADQAVTFHVGGVSAGAPLSRTVFLPLPQVLRVSDELSNEIHLDLDVAAVFAGRPPLQLAQTSQVMEPADGAPIADRFASAFRVDHVHNLPRRAGAPAS